MYLIFVGRMLPLFPTRDFPPKKTAWYAPGPHFKFYLGVRGQKKIDVNIFQSPTNWGFQQKYSHIEVAIEGILPSVNLTF